ncbi:MAG: InlB B-repeat-containing protein [Acholeplasmatales bacterium]|nr:InlB B-repeat-containing protein [Acholeplasmatales bacterium]
MKKRKIFLGVLLASAAIGLAACGGNNKEPNYDTEQTVTGDPALKVAYTVTFVSNGGTAVNSVQVNDGEKLVEPTAPTKAEDANYTYTFAGWYKDDALQNAFDFDTEVIKSAITLYAKWNQNEKLIVPVTYVVSFNTNGGNDVASQTVESGGKVTRPTDPTKAEDANYTYAFAGWYADQALQTEFDFNAEIISTTTIYAKWTQTPKQAPQPDKFLVSFNTNGGTDVAPVEVEEGAKLEAPSAPTKSATAAESYTFAGWYKDESLQQEFNFDTDTITEAITLYAKWNSTPIEYQVAFVSNGGTTVSSQTIAYGQKATEPTAPIKEADAKNTYTFSGWYTDEDLTEAYSFNTEITGSLTLYAKWNETINEYTVAFVSNGGTNVQSQSIAYGAKASEPDAPSKVADAQYTYTFGGWYIDEECTKAYNFELQITGAITLYAKWNESVNYYEISFISNGGSAVAEQSIPYGSKAAEPSTPAKQEDEYYTYSFAGWYKTSDFQEGTEYDFDTTVTGKIILYAKWDQTLKQAPQPDTFVVSFNTNGGTNVAPVEVEDGSKITEPTEPTKAATVAETYTFAGWYTDAELQHAYNFDTEVTGSFTLYAKWSATPVEYTVTFDTNGGTEVASQTVTYGSKLNEPANPSREDDENYTYTFVNWYRDEVGTALFDFDKDTVTSSFTLYALWYREAKPQVITTYEIAFNTNGGTAIDNVEVEEGSKLTEPASPAKAATAAETYTFAGWYSDSNLQHLYNFDSEVTSSFTLFAKWIATPVEYQVTFNSNGGTAVSSQSVAYGQKAAEPTAPTKAEDDNYTYTFAGWYKDSSLQTAFDFGIDTITSATTLYAKWTETAKPQEEVKYTVTFNTNGGSYIAPREVVEGENVSKPTNPTKEATATETYTFAGWYTDESLTKSFSFSTTPITSDITLYAKWEASPIVAEDSITVGFGADEGLTPWTKLMEVAGVTESDTGKTDLGKTVSYNGFSFNSSKHRIDGTSTSSYSYNSQSSTITFTLTSTSTICVVGTWASSTAGQVYLKNGSTTVYTSASLTSGADLSFNIELEPGTYTISSDKSIKLTKLYKVTQTVKVTFSSTYGSVSPVTVEKGGKLDTLPTLYEEGYVFQGWFTDPACTQEFNADTAITSNTTLYAGWIEYNANNYVTVTFNTGLSSETIDPVVIDKNSKLTNVPELSLDGYRFDGWYTNAALTTTFNPNASISSDITLYAKFVQQFTVTFKYEDNTEISSLVLDINEHIDSNDIPTPKFIYGYTFENWYNGNNVFDFNNTAVTSNLTLVAKYVVEAQSSTVKVIDKGTSFETLYAEFTQFDTATEYNAYVKLSSASNYTKLDSQLIRKYISEDGKYNYYRVDAVGLKAGTYTLKIVPIINNAEATAAQTELANLVVEAHDRSGFGFVNGSSSGAYNDDGTLKSNAQVVYVTESNKDTVTLAGVSGVQNIIAAMKAQKTISTPVAIRFLGNITDPANMPNGDLYLDDVQNLTVEGIGTDATMNGFGIVIKNSSNVEIRNLGFMNCNSKEGDDCGLQQANDHIWVHNCDFFYGDAGSDADQAKGDGALDTKKSTYVTHSYNHFWDNGKCNLQGMKDETTSNYITYHHNWYDHSDSRHPRIRTCTVHIYNNYFDGNAKYGVGVTMGASAFVEGNYFRSTATMKPMLSSMQGTDALGDGTFSGETGGIIKAYNNTFDGNVSFISYQQNNTSFDAYVATSRNEQVSSSIKTVSGGTTYNNFDTSSSMYSYTAQSPAEAKATVTAKAGRVQGGDFKWTFNDATEDSNYAVIKALKDALTSYSSKLLSVQSIGEQSSGGSTTPTGTTVADVISMIDALPTPANVVEADRTAIMAAKEAFDSLSSSDQSQVTNSSKLTQCINALPVPSSFTIDFRTYTVETGTNNVTFYNSNNLVMTATKISGQDTTNGIKFDKGKSFTITNNNSSTKTFVLTVVGNGSDKSFTVNGTTTTFNKTATTITFTIAAGGSTTITTSTGGAYVTTIDVA